MFAKVYSDVIVIINILTAIACCFVEGFDNDACFIAKVCYKEVFIRGIMIVKCEGVIIIRLFCNEGVRITEFISTSYFYIKFIVLFKYLTLYHVLNFES